MAEAQSQPEGSSARRRSGKTALGSECPGVAVFPDVVTRLSANVSWTTNLGNAFLAQQQDVMDAVQRMRAKAQNKGALQTTEQQKVETETVEGGQEAIVIEPANPQFVYVPSYDPAVVYGPPGDYPYPAYYYPGCAWSGAGIWHRTHIGSSVGKQLGQL